MSAGGNQPKSSRLETGCKSVNVVDSELDLDFPVIRHVRQYKRMRSQQTYIAIRLQRALPALTVSFFTFLQKRNLFLSNCLKSIAYEKNQRSCLNNGFPATGILL
jgi:hypothetical protein